MCLKDMLIIIKKRLFRKYNIFLSLFLILIFILSFSLITSYDFFTTYPKQFLNNNINFRRLSISKYDNNKYLDLNKEDLEFLKNLEFVDYVYSSKYLGYQRFGYNALFQKNGLDGSIEVTYAIKNTIKTSKNIKFDENSEGVMVCPKKFYPDSNININGLNYSKILKGESFIGNKIKLFDLEFTIIDTYDSDYYSEVKNVCFISLKDYKKIINKNNTNSDETYGYVIQINNYKNVDYALNYLTGLGYKLRPNAEIIYDEMINPVLNMTKIISLIVIFLSIIVIILIIKKKNKNSSNSYKLLECLGYSDNLIIKITNLELIIITILSFIISMIIFMFLFLVLKYIILNEFLVESNSFQIPWFLVLLTILILEIYILIVNIIEMIKR